jgi:hypothetical protein
MISPRAHPAGHDNDDAIALELTVSNLRSAFVIEPSYEFQEGKIEPRY